MQFPTDIATWLKLVGWLSTGLGSLVLAWRLKTLLTSVKNAMIAHEHAIGVLFGRFKNDEKNPIMFGYALEAAEFEDKLGLVLFVLGLVLIGLGQLAAAASYLIQ